VPTDMTGGKAAADFRMSAIIHGSMRSSQLCIVPPLNRRWRRRKRRGAKRILREIARPFEHLVRSWRKLSAGKTHS
jgi:hypothetical protein